MSWFGDIRLSFRTLVKNPGFTAVAVTMLAAGIGVNATVFTVTNAVLFKGFALVERNDRLRYIGYKNSNCCVSYPDFLDWRAQSKSFEQMAIVHGVSIALTDASGFPENLSGNENSAGVFKLVGAKPILGRDFTPDDEAPGAAPVAILYYGFWERRYGKDPNIVGRTLRMNGALTTVIGVMPQGFSFPQRVDVWVPLVQTPRVMKRDNRDTWIVVGRLAEGVTIESARAEMEIIGRRLAAEYPVTNHDLLPEIQTFSQFFIGSNATLIYGSMWGGGIRAFDRVRQSGESLARPRDWKVPRDFRPYCTGRGEMANHPAAPDRERDAIKPRRLPRLVDRQMGCTYL
jgi:putative ABC transport system permease protein